MAFLALTLPEALQLSTRYCSHPPHLPADPAAVASAAGEVMRDKSLRDHLPLLQSPVAVEAVVGGLAAAWAS